MKKPSDTVLQFEMTGTQVAEAIGLYLASRGLLSELSEAMIVGQAEPTGTILISPLLDLNVDARFTRTGFSRGIETVEVDIFLKPHQPVTDPDNLIRKRVIKR